MVTIEQKLSLFSKLLQQDIKTEIGEKIEAMEKEYEVIMAEQKRKVDKDADDIIEHERKKIETYHTGCFNRGIVRYSDICSQFIWSCKLCYSGQIL